MMFIVNYQKNEGIVGGFSKSLKGSDFGIENFILLFPTFSLPSLALAKGDFTNEKGAF